MLMWICIRMENVWRMEMDVRRIRMSLGSLGRRRGVRIRSREMGGEADEEGEEEEDGWMKRKKGDRPKKRPSIF